MIDSNSKKYSLDIKATTKDNSEVVCYSEEKRTIEYTDKSWNINPGFIVNYNARKTDLSTETKKFVDSALESRVLYDINGVEYKRENRVLEYPERDYVDRFRFGLPETSLRTPSSVIEERIERKGLEKSIGYVEVKEYNNVVDRHENYYRLSNEHGLGTMHFNLGTITQEDYEKLPKEYSEEEIELLAINDSSITTDALKQAYSNSRQR